MYVEIGGALLSEVADKMLQLGYNVPETDEGYADVIEDLLREWLETGQYPYE